MNPRLLRLLRQENSSTSARWGRSSPSNSPRSPARLGMRGIEVADPYVERLLEGVAFLAARVQLKLDAEFPRFTQALLEIVYPHYLAPTPSMLVAQLHRTRTSRPSPAGTASCRAAATLCSSRPGRLHRLRVPHGARCDAAPGGSHRGHLLLVRAGPAAQRAAARTVGQRRRANPPEGDRGPELRRDDDRPSVLLSRRPGRRGEQAATRLAWRAGSGVLVRTARGGAQDVSLLPARAIQPVGFADDEALLPLSLRSFQGYRLLQEYFAFPQRYRFVELTGLRPACGG